MATRSLTRKILLTLLVLGGLGLYVGAGTYAIFTAQTTNAGNAFQAGTVRMAGQPPSGAAVFDVPALLPGDAVEQPVTILNTGSLDFSYTMLVSPLASSALDQDPINGAQLRVDRCVSGRWVTPTPTGSAHVCLAETPSAGSTVVAVYSGPVVHRVGPGPAPVPMDAPLPSGGAHNLNLTVSLPSTALDAGVSSQSSSFDFRWHAAAQAASPTPGVIATPPAASPTATPTPLPGTTSSVTNYTVSAVSNLSGATAVHVFRFTTGRPLIYPDTVAITYPSGLSIGTLGAGQVSVQPRAGARFLPAASVGVTSQTIAITWPSGASAGAGDQVTVEIAGRTNPLAPASFALSTSQQTGEATALLTVVPATATPTATSTPTATATSTGGSSTTSAGACLPAATSPTPTPGGTSTKTWLGGSVNGVWSNANNWSPAGVPGSGDSVYVDLADSVTVDVNATVSAIYSRGELKVAAGKSLTVTSSMFHVDNTVILIGNASLTLGDGVTTGTFRTGPVTVGEGTLVVTNNATLVATTLSLGSGSAGLVQVDYGGTATVEAVNVIDGNVEVNGSLSMCGLATWSAGTLRGSGTVTITSTGTWQLNGSALPAVGITIGSAYGNPALTFVNQGKVHWQAGTILVARNLTFTNQPNAVFDVQGGDTWSVAANTNATFTNTGTFKKTVGGTTTIGSPPSNSSFTFDNGSGTTPGTVLAVTGTLAFDHHYAQAAGTTNLSDGATLRRDGAGDLSFGGGVLSGTGTIALTNGNVYNSGAQVRPGGDGVVGTLSITGGYLQTAASGAMLNLDIGGGSACDTGDRLAVSGTATLDGTVNVAVLGPCTPATNTAFDLLTYGTRSGTFAAEAVPAGYTATYQPNAYRVTKD